MESVVGILQLLRSLVTRREDTTNAAEETLDTSAVEVERETPTLDAPVHEARIQTPTSAREVKSESLPPPIRHNFKTACARVVGSRTHPSPLKHNFKPADDGVQAEIDEILIAFRKNDVAWMEAKLEDLKKQGTRKTKKAAGAQEREDHSEFIFAEPEYEWVDEFEDTSRPARTPYSSMRRLGESQFKEHGLRPMDPGYYRIAHNSENDEERAKPPRNHNGSKKASKRRERRNNAQSAAFTF
ncbi:hypothetical protein Y032_0394g629 [Ancylostoma ceylanicum]|uniref:Uncharacterized protein n=1 Tax=Ancylostoma ceylanicum TaxID=53326 RepID=A0A016RSI7_9BILA|nr:hypothetical protein Y032_0394g629 [Ancylostoma ceylanicum]